MKNSLLFGLCIGHPSPDRPAQVKPRLSQAAVLHHETYDLETEHIAIEQYDARLGAFYKREGLKAAGWSEQVIARLRSVSNLHGREHLFEESKRLGFGLR